MAKQPIILIAALFTMLIMPAAYFAGTQARDKAPESLLSKELLDNYIIISSALASDSTKGIDAAARRFAVLANSYYESKPKKDEPDELRESAQMISAHAKMLSEEKNDIETTRKLFAVISDELSRAFATTYKGADKDKYHIFLCSMVGHYWIQKDANARNPYFGKRMLGCGSEVKEVTRAAAPGESDEEYDPFAVVDAPPSPRAEAIMKNLKCACCGKPLIPATCGCAAATGAKVKNAITEMEDDGMKDEEIIIKLRNTFGAKVVPESYEGNDAR